MRDILWIDIHTPIMDGEISVIASALTPDSHFDKQRWSGPRCPFDADHLTPAAAGEQPFVEATPNLERILEVVVGPGGRTIEREREVTHQAISICVVLPPA